MKRGDPFYWILAIVGLVVLGSVGASMVYTRQRLLALYDEIFPRYGLDPSWGKGIALWENRGTLDPSRINMTGGDKARGGAWGLNQITLQTAREHGFTGDAKELLDPRKNVEWMARILSSPLDRHGVRRDKPKSMREAATMWNSGTYPGDVDTPEITLSEYVPGVEKYAATV